MVKSKRGRGVSSMSRRLAAMRSEPQVEREQEVVRQPLKVLEKPTVEVVEPKPDPVAITPTTTPEVKPTTRAQPRPQIGLSHTTNSTLESLAREIAEQTGARVVPSHVVRALLVYAENNRENISKRIRKLGPLKVPPLQRQYDKEREDFDQTLGAVFE